MEQQSLMQLFCEKHPRLCTAGKVATVGLGGLALYKTVKDEQHLHTMSKFRDKVETEQKKIQRERNLEKLDQLEVQKNLGYFDDDMQVYYDA